jgi:hypothetical protein
MSKRQSLLWLLLLASSIVFFFHSLIYGAGRGITLIPYGEENTRLLEYTRIGTYLLMLMGICLWRFSSKSAFWLLLAAIIGRVFLEYHVSLLRSMYDDWSIVRLTDVCLVTVFYMLSIVLPACVLIDLWRYSFGGKSVVKSKNSG